MARSCVRFTNIKDDYTAEAPEAVIGSFKAGLISYLAECGYNELQYGDGSVAYIREPCDYRKEPLLMDDTSVDMQTNLPILKIAVRETMSKNILMKRRIDKLLGRFGISAGEASMTCEPGTFLYTLVRN